MVFTAGLILVVIASFRLVDSHPSGLFPLNNAFEISQAWALEFDAEMGRDSINLEQSESIKKEKEMSEALGLGDEMDELQMPLVSFDQTNSLVAPRRSRQVILPYRDAAPQIRDHHNW